METIWISLQTPFYTPSETSSKGWKLGEYREYGEKCRLPKLPLRDGNQQEKHNGNRWADLPKLPLRDGNKREMIMLSFPSALPKLPLRDGNPPIAIVIAGASPLPKLPLRDGNTTGKVLVELPEVFRNFL